MQSISDFCLQGAEAGVGLALQDDEDFYLLILAGTRHYCPPGERFYAGIGGHLKAGEDWLACAHREALEEVGTDVDGTACALAYVLRNVQGNLPLSAPR
jgi:ADP-ribose pyrophosphatase YjhB (NUDIX family)